MFKNNIDLDVFIEMSKNTLGDHLGIEFVEKGEDFLRAKMPVDHRTKQPFGLLHGGASVALAETLGSIASVLCLDDHLRSVTEGWVYGTVRPIHIGRRTHVWDIKITDENQKLVCISRLTVAIV
jgi:1,4-dihydroxy-2-naphthoyl-CoA hydrolase